MADRKLEAAISHHQAGRLAEAKRLYTETLSQEPKHPVALHYLGVIAYQQGDAGQAIALIGNALAIKPDCADAHNNLASGRSLVERSWSARARTRESTTFLGLIRNPARKTVTAAFTSPSCMRFLPNATRAATSRGSSWRRCHAADLVIVETRCQRCPRL